MVDKLVSDRFLKDQNWAHLSINSLKFYTACFYCLSSWGLSKNIKLSSGPFAFPSYMLISSTDSIVCKLLVERTRYKCLNKVACKEIFITLSNIYDEAFCLKQITIPAKYSVIWCLQSSEYVYHNVG